MSPKGSHSFYFSAMVDTVLEGTTAASCKGVASTRTTAATVRYIHLLRAKRPSNLQEASFLLEVYKNMFPCRFRQRGNLIEGNPIGQWLRSVMLRFSLASGYRTHPKVGCRRRDCLQECWEPTALQLRLQDNPLRSVEVGGDGEEVDNVCPAKRRTARP